jgi:hypothetical protein
VTVTNPIGTSATGPADQFSYQSGPPPTIKKLAPKKGPAAGGTTVTITGTGFTGATAVHFGTPEGTGLKVNSDKSITVTVPAHAKGTVDVTVTTPNGTSAISAKDHFKYR